MTIELLHAEWHDVGMADGFVEEAAWPVVAGGEAIAMLRLGEEIFAPCDLCPHGAARLSDCWIEDGRVECPLHQGTFDIRTGAACEAPCTEPVRTFPVRVLVGRVQAQVVP